MSEGFAHLALITETYPPEVNGVAHTLQRMVVHLRERGYRVTVLRPQQTGERAGGDLFRALSLPFYPQVRVGYSLSGHIGQRLRALRPDLVHIATEGPLGLAGLRAARHLKIPMVSSFHTNFDGYARHYRLQFLQGLVLRYLRCFHNATRKTLVPSRGTFAHLQAQGFLNLAMWRRGVDTALFNPCRRSAALRAQLGLDRDDALLIYVGRLAHEKNLPVLVNAYESLRKTWQGPGKLHLALIGDGPLAAGLTRQRLAGFSLEGIQKGEDLARWYASADLFCFPSCSETFGNVVLEAMASALPVLAYDTSGVNEHFRSPDEGALLPLEGDFASAISKLLMDRARLREMGQRARQRAEGQTWTHIIDALLEEYRNSLDSVS
ncbi:glycosyltransferase family 1 protein [Acidithiobacillus sp.]|uniref:glycosyltransferase family 4 protein n=1 Tax=Acidithiobacillus sp. TaxID=1872118 RepID=UPI002631FF2B|nr:glycosyltransferase family 1 protein [Acidithiobacillus sp.]